MITERKLRSLRVSTRLRKIARMLHTFEETIRSGERPDRSSVRMVVVVANETLGIAGDDLIDWDDRDALMRQINTIRGRILKALGDDPADWDLLPRWRTGTHPDAAGTGRPVPSGCRAFLEDIRSPFNVGALFRTAAAFSVEAIALSADCASPTHPRAERSAMGMIDAVPWRVDTLAGLAETEPNLFALETGGVDIGKFVFPPTGTVIVGNEELGISPEARSVAESRAGIVSIPLTGPKASLNVSVAFGILIHEWSARTDG